MLFKCSLYSALSLSRAKRNINLPSPRGLTLLFLWLSLCPRSIYEVRYFHTGWMMSARGKRYPSLILYLPLGEALSQYAWPVGKYRRYIVS